MPKEKREGWVTSRQQQVGKRSSFAPVDQPTPDETRRESSSGMKRSGTRRTVPLGPNIEAVVVIRAESIPVKVREQERKNKNFFVLNMKYTSGS